MPGRGDDPDHPDAPLTANLPNLSGSFRSRWVPWPLRLAGWVVIRWIKGPIPPRDLLFRPLFPSIQERPVRYLERFFPKRRHKIALLLFLYSAWFLAWSLVLLHSSSAGHIEGIGKPNPISCAASFWSPKNGCGLHGNECRPFRASTFAFRCPSNCQNTLLLEPYTVGNQTLHYQPLVIGGPEPESPSAKSSSTPAAYYRADSLICQAAIHDGVITNAQGGCGVVKLKGAAHSYPSVERHGLLSTSFPSTFPKSYSFIHLSASQQMTCPPDPQWTLLAITAVALGLLSLLTTSPAVFFFSTFVILMLHVGFVSDHPNLPSVLDLFSLFLSRMLPATFIVYVLYLYCARPLLTRLASPKYQISKTVLYLPPTFIGALNNYTFALWIPIERLTPQDVQEQPGAKIALAIVVTIIALIVLSQAWYIRLAGLMPRYIKIYFTMGAVLIFLLLLPGLRLRIHHYILAILFMPGTAIPTRPSVIYQGLLLGLFINGVARWGFASIIETPEALGEQPSGTGGLNGWWGAATPNITNSSVSISLEHVPVMTVIDSPRFNGNGNITFHLWEPDRMAKLGLDGISVLVNDVERWRGYVDEDRKGRFTWRRQGHRGLELRHNVVAEEENPLFLDPSSSQQPLNLKDEDESEDEDGAPEDLFFRFAFMRGAETGLYGGVGVWNRDGSWIPPPPPIA